MTLEYLLFNKSARYEEPDGFYARVKPTGEYIGPYESAAERDEDLQQAIEEWVWERSEELDDDE